MSDIAFEQILAQQSEVFKEAESFKEWMPPAGQQYTCVIKEPKRKVFTDKQSKQNLPRWVVAGEIIDCADASLEGKSFTLLNLTPKMFGKMKDACLILTGEQINDLPKADAVIMGSAGAVVKVDVREIPRKTGGMMVVSDLLSLISAPGTAEDEYEMVEDGEEDETTVETAAE